MTTYPIKIKEGLHNNQGKSYETIIRELAVQGSQAIVASVAAVTDSSTGTPAGVGVAITLPVAVVDTAVSGSNLATKASFEGGLVNVQDALVELFTKANAYATKLSLNTITYNGGGAAADGTIGAITKVPTGGTTGPTAVLTNPVITSINGAFYELAVLCNQIAAATGNKKITFAVSPGVTYTSTVGALSTSTGTAAAPGLSVTDGTTVLTNYANAVATFAALLNTANAGVTARVVVIR